MKTLEFIWDEINYRWQCGLHQMRHGVALRKIVVNGSPKSGTTWMRQLLTAVPHHRYVGNFKSALHQFDSIVLGDVVHSHHAYTLEFADALTRNDIRTIYMLRDPRDRCVSHLFHALRQENHPHHHDLKALNQHDQLLACMGGRTDIIPENWALDWMETTQAWLNSGFLFCLVRYEDILADPTSELRRVFDFLDMPISNGLLEAIIATNRFERKTVRHHIWHKTRKPGEEDTTKKLRKGIQGDWRNYFAESHIKQFKSFASKQLIEWGYEKDDQWTLNHPDR